MIDKLLICFLFALSIIQTRADIPANYSVLEYYQKIDHSSYTNLGYFNQRYIISTNHWKPNGPIFFYAGNEGDIFSFANNTGFMWENAAQFNAMVVFMEHRYYGKSMPFGRSSFRNLETMGYLTVEQVLADYALFLTDLKSTTKGAADSPVVVFGGSYGGMLAAWFRMKYPHIVIGALAASAPILQFPGIYDCNKYFEITTKDFENYSPKCSESIYKSWEAIRRVAKTDEGKKFLTEQFRLCGPLKDVDNLIGFLSDVWVDMAMTDYPNPANFLQPMPAYPIKVACQYLTTPEAEDRQLIKTIFSAVSIYTNYTGQQQCNSVDDTMGGLGDLSGWDFQSCTEMVLPVCSNGKTDMFERNDWNFTTYSADCEARYTIGPEKLKAEILFGGNNIKSASNIIFSNGDRDPWSAGGVLQTLSPTLPAIQIPGACHHEDLRFTGPNDPQTLIDVRLKEINIIKGWLDTYYKEHKISI